MSCCRSFLGVGRRSRSVIAWEHGVCLTSCRGQETPLEVLLVGTDATGGKPEGLFQVVEYLKEGHPRPFLWWRRTCAQVCSQHALTAVQMPVKAVPRIQRQGDLGRYPRASDGPGLLEFRQEGPELLRGEGAPGQCVACAYAPCFAAAVTSRALLAANTPGADAAVLRGMGPPNEAVPDHGAYRAAERTDQGKEVVQKDLNLVLCAKEDAHVANDTHDSAGDKIKRRGSIQQAR